jgi:uncharacterized protein (DUF2141 family)
MKKVISVMLILISVATGYAQADLQITVKGVRGVDGSVRVGLFNHKRDFLKKIADGRSMQLTADSATAIFRNLPPGDYGISVFHDRNNNGKMDTNRIGIPSEGFAFGNNAMGLFGPPSFDKAKITIKDAPQKQLLLLKYF